MQRTGLSRGPISYSAENAEVASVIDGQLLTLEQFGKLVKFVMRCFSSASTSSKARMMCRSEPSKVASCVDRFLWALCFPGQQSRRTSPHATPLGLCS